MDTLWFLLFQMIWWCDAPSSTYSMTWPQSHLSFCLSPRPFHVEPRNIIGDDPQERVSAEAAILNSRVHYYGRLTGSSDRLLVRQPHEFIKHTLKSVQIIVNLTSKSHSSSSLLLTTFRCLMQRSPTFFDLWRSQMSGDPRDIFVVIVIVECCLHS